VKTTVSDISKDIVWSLSYFDVFNYPLTEEEIRNCSKLPGQLNGEITEELNQLVDKGMLYKFDHFYSLQDKPELIPRRVKGNELAEKLMKKAHRKSRFISRFPYVRSVCLSGSISKGFIDDDADIDFFIITKPKRLWIARTCLIMYKKVFLLNSYKYFCINYLIDSDNLNIEEKNLFTATELMTLIPVYGKNHYEEFFAFNTWAKEYYPNYPQRPSDKVPEHKAGVFKRFMEFCLNNRFGDWLDKRFMNMTVKRWKKKFSHFDSEDFKVAMKSRQYVSKHHPGNFQRRVIDVQAEKIKSFEQKHNTELS
jgi:predicted nucleotidyltransferase